MFSATNLVVVGTIVALFGGFLLITEPIERQDVIAPTASTDEVPAAPVAVSGHIAFGRCGDGEITELDGNVRRSVDAPCGPFDTSEVSDPRLAGEVTINLSHDFHRAALDGSTPQVSVYHWIIDIVNEQGAWRGLPALSITTGGDAQMSTFTSALVGEGAYAGLMVVAEMSPDSGHDGWNLRGVIIDGDTPVAPSNPASQ